MLIEQALLLIGDLHLVGIECSLGPTLPPEKVRSTMLLQG